MVYDINYELPDKRAMIEVDYKDAPVDSELMIKDKAGNLYSATVETRVFGGVVVKVKEVLVG